MRAEFERRSGCRGDNLLPPGFTFGTAVGEQGGMFGTLLIILNSLKY